MLIDKYMNEYDFNEIHTIVVEKTPEHIYPLLKVIDLRKSGIINLLFSLRGLPRQMRNLQGFISLGFILLEEKKNDEIVIGMIGQPWKRKVNLLQISPDQFLTFDRDGYIKVAWNFKLFSITETKTIAYTETRIQCSDQRAKRLFSLYWAWISRFSGIVRMCMLNLIKREAEKTI
ncbi:MAG: hypothetical protein ABIJ44_08150 [Pseudomonadota bacterium]